MTCFRERTGGKNRCVLRQKHSLINSRERTRIWLHTRHQSGAIEPCGVRGCTTSGRYVRILDLREGNEESSEEITGCKASVYAEFDDCPRVGKFVKLLDFRHFERHMMFSQSDRKTYKKAISDGVNVSVVLDVGCGNT